MMSQKTDTMIKLALVFTISLLSFSIGTYVGKMYSDNQHKLAQLEPKDQKSAGGHQEFATGHTEGAATTITEAEKALGTTVSHSDSALTDSEVAKIAEEFATEDVESEGKPILTTSGEKEIKTVSPLTSPVSVRSQTAVKTQTVATDERVPASIPTKKDIAPMQFTVQAGAFPTEVEAQKLTKDLLNKGYKTSVVPAQVNGQTWFRVNVGLFGSFKEASEYKTGFLEKTQLPSAFVQKVQK